MYYSIMVLTMEHLMDCCKRQVELKSLYNKQQKEIKNERQLEHYRMYQPKSYEYKLKVNIITEKNNTLNNY